VAAAAVPSRAPAAPRAELLAGRCGRAVPAPGGDSYRDGAPRSAPQPLAKFVRPRAGCGRTRPPSRALAMITLRLVAGLAWRPRAAASRPRGGPRRSGGAGGRGEERAGLGRVGASPLENAAALLGANGAVLYVSYITPPAL